ncbi:unnamed protein product [Schistosoma guineensis]|nr:unnamed protein product [Schistosoma guineensis]
MIDNGSLENAPIPNPKLCGSNQSPGVLQCICRFILSQQSKIYGGLVEYIDGASVGTPRINKNEGDKAFTKDNCCDDVRRSSQCDKLTLTIETLLVGENCLEHCGDNQLPVYVMEQWTAQVLPQNFKNRGISISGCQSELLDYIQTSPLMAAIKEPGRPRRYKLTHRSYVCDRISQVGDSFLMDASDILSMDCLSDRNKNSQDDDHDGSSVSKIVRQMDGCESPIKRVFTPVCISEKEILHITVVTLKHLPQQFLGCPLCLNSTYSTNKDSFTMLSRARCHSPETFVDLDVRKKNTALVSRTTYGKPNVHPPNFLNLPKCSSNEEVVRSPIVVMADTEEKFIQSTFDNPFYNILPPCSSLDCTESGHSTLTKKSSRLTDSNRICQIPLESPPRKQQRISCYAHELSSETKDSDDSNEMPSSVTPTINKTPGVQREGCINKVIAEFTLLNVERDLIMNSVDDSNIGSVCIPPVNACFSSPFDVHRDSIQCSQLSYSTAKKRDHASESQLGTDSEDSVLLTSPSASSQPVPRLSRRRNATSVSVWPSSSFHNDGTPFFNRRTGLPLQSSPVPLKRSTSGKFDFDLSLNRMKTSRSSICMVYNHNLQNSSEINTDHVQEPSSGMESLKSDKKFNNNTDNSSNDNNETNSNKSNQTITSFRRRPSSLRFTSQYQEQSFERNTVNSSIIGGSNNRHTVTGARRRNYPVEMDSIELSCSAPPSGGRGFQPHKNITSRLANTMACTPVPHGSSQHLLVNFEESMLNGRIHPVGQVEGFSIELGASGSFYPNHIRLPMKAYFFNLSDDNAPSPYLGYADLKQLPSNKGYHIPKKGSIQLTLFNPTGLVVKMFVIVYDLADMPPNCQTFLRQRTVYMPIQQHNQFHSSYIISNSTQSTSLHNNSTCSFHKPQYHSTHTNTNHLNCNSTPSTSMINTNVSMNNTLSNCNTDHLWNISSKSLTEPNTPSFLSYSSSCSCSSITSIGSLSSYGSQNAVNNNNTTNSNTTTTNNTTGIAGVSLNTRNELPAYLRYLVHLRFHTTRSGKLYLHTDLRLIFSRDKFEFDPRIATYELRSFVDAPSNPRYSPKKWSTRHQNITKYQKSIHHSKIT